MMGTLKHTTTLLLAAGITACSPVKPTNQTAVDLELDGPVRSNYHHLAENPYGQGLLHAGFIVGIEKTKRELLGVSTRKKGYCERFHDYPHEGGENRCSVFPEANADADRRTEILGDHLIEMTNDGSPMFVSHILEYRPGRNADGTLQPRIDTEIVYNIHPSFPGGQEVVESEVVAEVEAGEREGYYHEGWNGLQTGLKDRVRNRLEEARGDGHAYTHLVIGAMGWDNDQVESVRRYNALLGNTIAQARKAEETTSEDAERKPFNPLFIGLTWPSVWGVDGYFDIAKVLAKLVGYGVKADDADEIGYTYANWLVNDLALEAKANNPGLKVVVLGHSFGARITSRAVFSRHLLQERPDQGQEHVDLLVGLQAAFSANRFIGGARFDGNSDKLPEPECLACGPGVEGAPYAELEQFSGHTVMTWSEHDGANPLAYLISRAAHMGGDRGHGEASKDRAAPFFELINREAENGVGEDGMLQGCGLPDDHRVRMIDASNFIYDHSDMLDEATGQLLWSAIECYAPPPSS